MSLKLRIELIPKTAWFSSLYHLIPREVWKSIRAERIKTAGAKCEICGSSVKPLYLHEIWKYDDEKHVQKLLRFQLLCRKCHWIKHIGLAKIKADRGELNYDELVKHFCKVNQCPKKQKPIYHGKLEDFDGEIRSGMLPLITEVDGVEYLTIAGTKKDLDFDQHVTNAFEVWEKRELQKEIYAPILTELEILGNNLFRLDRLDVIPEYKEWERIKERHLIHFIKLEIKHDQGESASLLVYSLLG